LLHAPGSRSYLDHNERVLSIAPAIHTFSYRSKKKRGVAAETI